MTEINKLDISVSRKNRVSTSEDTQCGVSHSFSVKQALLPTEMIRPSEVIRYLHDILLPVAEPCPIPPGRQFPSKKCNHDMLWLVTSGNATIYRSYDELKIGVAEGPLILGLQRIISPFDRHMMRVSRNAVVFSLPAALARNIIDKEGLWKEAAEVLAYYLRMMVYRDEHLVSQASYTAIRVKLLEYLANKEVHIQNRMNVAAYIQSSTTLSKSLIYQVIGELEEGGYISITKGKLDSVSFLPERI